MGKPHEPVDPVSQGSRVAWAVLVFLSAAFAVNHLAGTVVYAQDDTDRLMLVVFAALNVYGLAVLLVPYRRRERWAWLLTWVSVVPFALGVVLVDPPVGWFYLATAVVMAAAQAVTLRDFATSESRPAVPQPEQPQPDIA